MQPGGDDEREGRNRGREKRRRGAVEARAGLLDEQHVGRVGHGRVERERVAEANPGGREHARHHPGPEQREAQRRPDAGRRMFAKEQRAAGDGEDGRDIADEARAGQRDMKRADVDREGETGQHERQGVARDILFLDASLRADA